MNDDQLLRYSRQIMLPQVDVEGQQRLLDSRVLIIGLGGLGSPVAMYLASGGVGHLTLVDDDVVDLTNLQRQIVHSMADIGRTKVASAAETLMGLNPEVQIETIDRRLERGPLLELIQSVDLVVDCSDNFPTRFLLNELCVEARRPLVSGAAIRMEGQVAVFHCEQDEQPCYRCLYRDGDEGVGTTCSESGVLAPVVGIIGAVQATEAMKVLMGVGETLGGKLLLLDATTMEWRALRLRRDSECPVCGCR